MTDDAALVRRLTQERDEWREKAHFEMGRVERLREERDEARVALSNPLIVQVRDE